MMAALLEDAVKAAPRAAKGPIYCCLLSDDLPGEVEIDLGAQFPVSPQIKGALKSMNGILEVEEI